MLSLIVFILILSCQFNRMLLPPSLFPRPLSMVGHSHPVPLAPMVVSSNRGDNPNGGHVPDNRNGGNVPDNPNGSHVPDFTNDVQASIRLFFL